MTTKSSITMNTRNILLLSSSRCGDSSYLSHAHADIAKTLAAYPAPRQALFIPYAGVTVSYDDYTEQVAMALAPLNITVTGIHQAADPVAAVQTAEILLVGGGNSFRLLERLYHLQLLAPIRQVVDRGIPYIGWSAGANIAGLSIATSNDMPIIEPPSFKALALVPLQINPHYLNYHIPGHNGETRLVRLQEYMALNPHQPVLALPEGTAVHHYEEQMVIQGDKEVYWLRHQQQPLAIAPGETIDHLIS